MWIQGVHLERQNSHPSSLLLSLEQQFQTGQWKGKQKGWTVSPGAVWHCFVSTVKEHEQFRLVVSCERAVKQAQRIILSAVSLGKVNAGQPEETTTLVYA